MDLEALKQRLAERSAGLCALIDATEENRKPVEGEEISAARLGTAMA